jgi:hypothetical protein
LLGESTELVANAGDTWSAFGVAVVAGALELAAGAHEEAAAIFGDLELELEAAGVREPGVFPFESDALGRWRRWDDSRRPSGSR